MLTKFSYIKPKQRVAQLPPGLGLQAVDDDGGVVVGAVQELGLLHSQIILVVEEWLFADRRSAHGDTSVVET